MTPEEIRQEWRGADRKARMFRTDAGRGATGKGTGSGTTDKGIEPPEAPLAGW